MTDTIFAPATAPGRAAVAVVRLSGPRSRDILRALNPRRFEPRVATLAALRGSGGEPIDQAMVLWFPGPRSYTGEDCVELQVHGGIAIVDALTVTLLSLGARLAEPGEFTRRAFENGKLDLAQAEAVADLIDAETRGQARQALGQLGGALGRRYDAWRALLIESLAYLEAGVDFPDEELPPELVAAARASLEALEGEIGQALEDQARGRQVRDGYRVAIVGATNAGKSSLLNAMVGRDAAIVSTVAGATRDIIEIPFELDGYKIVVADMAGIRLTEDPVEAEGVRRARAWATDADLRLWVVDASIADGSWREAVDLIRAGDVCLLNKTDLDRGADGEGACRLAGERGLSVMELCLLGGDALKLIDHLRARLSTELSGADFPAATRARHAALLGEAQAHLARALMTMDEPELAAEDVRLAARSLGRVAGKVGAEDVLDRVFSTFCIGK